MSSSVMLYMRGFLRDPWLFMPLLILLFAAPFFFVGGPDWSSGPLFTACWDLGHLAFFSLLFMLIQRKHALVKWQQWLTVTLVVLVISCVIEFIQTKVGRDGDWHDVVKNLTGTWLGLFWFQKPRPLVWAGRVLAILLLIPPLFIVARMAYLQEQAGKKFPLLSDFEQPYDVLRWEGPVAQSQDYASQGKYSLKISLTTRKFSQASFKLFFGDWTGYEQLMFDVYNPGKDVVPMTLRIYDAEHELRHYAFNDRFNQSVLVSPGWNHYSFSVAAIENSPKDRKLDLQMVHDVTLFATRLPKPQVIYLDNFRLE